MFGATHALEIIYAMNNMDVNFFGFEATDVDRALSATMMEAWSSFVRTGSPSQPEGWVNFGAETNAIALFADPTVLVEGIREGRCEALRDLGIVR